VIFDWDGTLINSSETGRRALRSLCKDVGRPQSKRDRKVIDEIWGGAGSKILDYLFPPETVRRLFPGRQYEEVREWLAIRWGKYSDSYRAPLFPGAKWVLRRLKRQGLLVAIATNAEAPRFLKNLANRGLNARHLDFSVSSSHSGRHSIGDLARLDSAPKFLVSPYRKPEHKYLRLLSDELRARDVLPQESLFVGDTKTDAEAALRLASYFAPVCYGPHSQSTSWWHKTLKELKMPDEKIIGTPVSLRDLYDLVIAFNAERS